MLYYCDSFESIDDVFLLKLLPYLSGDRIAQINRYRFRSDRVQAILAYILLRLGLHREFDINKFPEITLGEQKKPYLIHPASVYFNLSHCKNAVACGIDCKELGVDVQHIVPYSEKLAKRFMTSQEIANCNQSDIAFTKLWTQKEAYGKYLGCGICYSMNEEAISEGTLSNGCICKSHLLQGSVLTVISRNELPLTKMDIQDLPCMCADLEKF